MDTSALLTPASVPNCQNDSPKIPPPSVVIPGFPADVRCVTGADDKWSEHNSVGEKSVDQWSITKPAQGIASAVRISGKSQGRDASSITDVKKPEIPSINNAAIQLLKKLKYESLPETIEETISDLQRRAVSPGSSNSFDREINRLIFQGITYADNGSVLEKLLELGWKNAKTKPIEPGMVRLSPS